MDRGTKRKAALVASPAGDRATKRQKTPEPPKAASSKVVEVGLRWVEQAHKVKDSQYATHLTQANSRGNLIATAFLTLPSKRDFPDYYKVTRMPLAIDTIERNVKNEVYSDITAVESDIRRLVQNAKDYNEPGSEIFVNAERLRKMTHNFMKVHNPAYKNKDYVARPTPLTPEVGVNGDGEVAKEAPPKIKLRTGGTGTIKLSTKSIEKDLTEVDESAVELAPETKAKAVKEAKAAKESRRSISAAVPGDAALAPDEEGYDDSFKGKTFQQAQEQIVLEMIKYKDDGSDLDVFTPFVNLPTRKLVDYYRMIKQPLSLNGLLKRVRGQHGREEKTGVSDFRTWDAFEHETSKIWENARTYNEDGSEIYALSQELENYFRDRLTEAKKHVEQPEGQTLKLSLNKSSGIKLKLGQSSTPVAAETTPRPPSAVAEPEPPRASSQKATTATPPAVNGVKAESTAPEEPAPAPAQPQAKPQEQPRPVSQSSAPRQPTHFATTYGHVHQQPAGFDNKFRVDDKDATSALITNVHLTTHPSMSQQIPPIDIDIPAHTHLTQQAVTLNVPASTSFIQLLPTVTSQVTANPAKRPFRLFVTANSVRISPVTGWRPSMQPSSNSPLTNGHTESSPDPTHQARKRSLIDPPTSAYDVRLAPGMNRVEVECVAVAEGALGAGTLAGKGGLEMERVMIFVHVLRA